MIIGISGKIQSGKDTVGKIIQHYLTRPDMALNSFTLLSEWEQSQHWKIKKFATKVKEVLSLLTGIPVEDFEKEEVKSSYLGEEWNRWKLEWYVSSPSDWADMHTSYHSTKQEALLRLGLIEDYEAADIYPHRITEEQITVRQALQWIGTNLFRDKFHPNTWCIALFSDYIGDIEVWKDIPGYERIYQISSFGRVKRLSRKSVYGNESKGEYHTYDEKILKATPSRGYLTVKLLNKETIFIHQMVANLFCNKNGSAEIINHKDQNRINNFYKNLEWTTQSKNILDANKYGNGNTGEKQFCAKLTEEHVKEIRRLIELTTFKLVDIAKMYNVGITTISDIKLNKKWKHVGNIKSIDPILPITPPNWIITDVRYENEAQAIKDRGGIVIRVDRFCFDSLEDYLVTYPDETVSKKAARIVYNNKDLPVDKLNLKLQTLPESAGFFDRHESEIALDGYSFDYTISNRGTLEELIKSTKYVLEESKII